MVIAGAGPAGAGTAIALAMLGHDVLLLEKSSLPAAKVGESLPPKIVRLLAILGVDREVEAAGFTRMAGTTVYAGDHLVRHLFAPEDQTDTERRGFQVDRARFEAILRARARSHGAHLFEGVTVHDVKVGTNDEVTAVPITLPDGSAHTITTKYFVDATGAKSTLTRRLGLRRREETKTVAVTGYFAGASLPTRFEAEDTLFEMFPEGWLWSVLLADGRRNVTIGLDPGVIGGGALRALYDGWVARSELVASLVSGATLIDDRLFTTDATWSHAERYAGANFVLAGDAASFIDPLTSHGVHKALHAAVTAASVIHTSILEPERRRLAFDYYDAQQRSTFDRYASIALTFYRASPHASSPFWAQRTRPELTPKGVLDPAQVDERNARRERFMTRVRTEGGAKMPIKAKARVAVEIRASAEGWKIAERDALVVGDEVITPPDPRLDVRTFFGMLDGRPLETVFEDYLRVKGESRSKGLAQALLSMLGRLAEEDALED